MYCQHADLCDYVLAAYLNKANELNPGCIERHIAQVAEELDGALLQGGYSLPLEHVPGKLTHIAAVMAAYRVVGNITSLMESEGSSGNEWIPLQSQYKQAVKDVDRIRTGQLQLFPVSESKQHAQHAGVEVATHSPLFDPRTWRKF